MCDGYSSTCFLRCEQHQLCCCRVSWSLSLFGRRPTFQQPMLQKKTKFLPWWARQEPTSIQQRMLFSHLARSSAIYVLCYLCSAMPSTSLEEVEQWVEWCLPCLDSCVLPRQTMCVTGVDRRVTGSSIAQPTGWEFDNTHKWLTAFYSFVLL